MAEQNAVTYSDLNPQLGIAHISDDILYGVEAVNSSIENIFGISVGEYWWYPDFGSHLRSYLFRPIMESTAQMIRNEMISIINLWDPRVEVTGCVVSPYPDDQIYEVSFSWRLKGQDMNGSLTFTLTKL